jgi:selenocysteine lyase/cysteine desulfurase
MSTLATTTLEQYFAPYREKVIGSRQSFETAYGTKPLIYADWTASGRLYQPIEELFMQQIAPFVGNTHTETTVTGSAMTTAYHHARQLIKRHCGAQDTDVLIAAYSGMTGVVNKFQRILGLKLHERFRGQVSIAADQRPIVLVSHMEHHSNQTSWLETIADVEVIPPDEQGLPDLSQLDRLLEKYRHRPLKIAAITSCSNVTGIFTPYHEVAERMHLAGGYCFVDFACSAPYIDIVMRPADNPLQRLDAIYFSPHKFLGGPGSTGILIFDSALYQNSVPDDPGGGTVDWTNPWGEHKYIDQIEAREDGGTPAFLQTIRAAMAIRLKEQMGVSNILEREHAMLERIWQVFDTIPNLHVLAGQHRDRLGVISFYIDDLHYNLGVSLLNDRFGVQVRGGCSCAGTYGHYLLNVDQAYSKSITSKINEGDSSDKPGWIRMSIHPVMTDDELDYVLDAIRQLAANHQLWRQDYMHVPRSNEYVHRSRFKPEQQLVEKWFSTAL